MANTYSMDDLLEFLNHASERGMMPAATASALAVAVRNVLGVLNENERRDLDTLDIEAAIKRFNNKRARDFSPSSLKEYSRRLHRAMDLYKRWIHDPSNFEIKTRVTKASSRKPRENRSLLDAEQGEERPQVNGQQLFNQGSGYVSSIPIRADWCVTITNVPVDRTGSEAERLAKFVRMLAVQPPEG